MKDGNTSAKDVSHNAERRAFLRTMTAATAALATGACSSSSVAPKDESSGGGSSGGIVAPNQPPVWQTVPTITFTQGQASSVSIAGYVSDANGNPLTIALQPGDPALPAGVTYDPVGKRFVYDGIGSVGSTNGHVLTADDGQP
jgi:hypothetical protein